MRAGHELRGAFERASTREKTIGTPHSALPVGMRFRLAAKDADHVARGHCCRDNGSHGGKRPAPSMPGSQAVVAEEQCCQSYYDGAPRQQKMGSAHAKIGQAGNREDPW